MLSIRFVAQCPQERVANFPEDQVLCNKAIAERAALSSASVSKAITNLIGHGLIERGSRVAIGAGRPVTQLVPTPAFTEAVAAVPEWRRSVQLQEMAEATGKSRGEIMDIALALARKSLLGSAEEEA